MCDARREAILAKLARDHADLELEDFEPPVGTDRLREFIDNRWGDKAGRTEQKRASHGPRLTADRYEIRGRLPRNRAIQAIPEDVLSGR